MPPWMICGRGSSPRMRGAPMEQSSGGLTHRIIPADAGSTMRWCSGGCWTWDHPRGCGEHVCATRHILHVEGSSPRMRGAHTTVLSSVSTRGIIPADAGSTRQTWMRQAPHRDHPRGCGEHDYRWVCRFSVLGIIPADAGSTTVVPLGDNVAGDHPRGCGEHCRCGSCRYTE